MKNLLLTFLFAFLIKESWPCAVRDFGESSFVCVCNSTYCNFDGPTTPLQDGQIRIVTNSKDQYRNFEQILDLPASGTVDVSDVNITIFVDKTNVYQTMLGFGGAFTDAASINIRSLSDAAEDLLLRLYFAEEGCRYNLVRTPIAGSDFSTRPYTYDEVPGDVDLEFFALADEDISYKLPVMRRAIELCPEELFIFGSPWSPPSWMKTNGNSSYEEHVIYKEMWQPYANYIVKFVEAYEAELGTELWGLTPQNEPTLGYDIGWSWNTCGWFAEDMRDWIKFHLGPTLAAAGYSRLKLLIDDYNRHTLPWYALPMLIDSNCSQYISGIAVHWYDDTFVGTEGLDETHDLAPDKFILHTEACEGSGPVQHVMLGSWERGEHYAFDIIENINHWTTGWVDWNMVLDMQGGPTWVDNFVDAPIIVDATVDEFYVQPMYYALSMFGRHVPRGSSRVYHTIKDDDDNTLPTATFVNPDGKTVIIMLNMSDLDKTVAILEPTSEYVYKTLVTKRSWVVLTY